MVELPKLHDCIHDAESHDPLYGCLMPDCWCKRYPLTCSRPTPPAGARTPRRPPKTAQRRFWRAAWAGLRVFFLGVVAISLAILAAAVIVTGVIGVMLLLMLVMGD